MYGKWEAEGTWCTPCSVGQANPAFGPLSCGDVGGIDTALPSAHAQGRRYVCQGRGEEFDDLVPSLAWRELARP